MINAVTLGPSLATLMASAGTIRSPVGRRTSNVLHSLEHGRPNTAYSSSPSERVLQLSGSTSTKLAPMCAEDAAVVVKGVGENERAETKGLAPEMERCGRIYRA